MGPHNQNRRRILRPLTIAIAILGLFFIWKFNTPDSMDGIQFSTEKEEAQRQSSKTKTKTPMHQRTPLSKKVPVAKRKSTQQDPATSFSYQDEVRYVRQLVAKLPTSKPRLLKLIQQPDPFKEQGRTVEPHTLAEQTQNQMGAVKVLALRELMKNQNDITQLSKDLQQVAQAAQDPTIRRIAEAAEQSLDQGRSFFDDFLDGLERLPLEEES